MSHDKTKKSNDNNKPSQIGKEKMLEISFSLRVLCCMIAGDIPISVKILKKAMITIAMATLPKSSGEIRRARIAATIKEITMPLYLAIAV